MTPDACWLPDLTTALPQQGEEAVPDDPASVLSPARLEPTRQLVGNNDEVTDLRFVGPPAAPTHVAVATNSEQVGLLPLLRPFHALRLFAVNCCCCTRRAGSSDGPSASLGLQVFKRGWGSLGHTHAT